MATATAWQVALKLVSSGILIGGAAGGYIPQFLEIRKTRNADGFSTHVSLVLIVANAIRIVFWFGQHFDKVLLIQSCTVIACQTALVMLCASVKYEGRCKAEQTKVPMVKLDLVSCAHFWKWDDPWSYLKVLLYFGVVMATLAYFFIADPRFVKLLGACAVGLEAILALPQAWRNYQTKSTRGLNLFLVVSWAVGDAYKVVFFLVSDVPEQFVYCAIFQLVTDVFILFQVFVLYDPKVRAHFDIGSWLRRRIRIWMISHGPLAQPVAVSAAHEEP